MYDCLKTLSLPVLKFISILDKIIKHLFPAGGYFDHHAGVQELLRWMSY